MKEHWEQECAGLRSDLAALQHRLNMLETKQAGVTGNAPTFPRSRMSRRMVMVMLPVVALLLAGGGRHAQGAIDALFIDQGGKLGIGTTTPNATLDVVGNVNVGGGPLAAGTLTVTNTTVKGTLTTEGNVGIGTTDIGANRLNVQGPTSLDGKLTVTGETTLQRDLIAGGVSALAPRPQRANSTLGEERLLIPC